MMASAETRHAFFTKIRDHLLAQNERCTDEGTCLYRHTKEDGTVLKCAIGFLLPDEAYSEDIEGKSIRDLPPQTVRSMGVDPYDVDFMTLLLKLQGIHDEDPVEEWPEILADFEASNFPE